VLSRLSFLVVCVVMLAACSNTPAVVPTADAAALSVTTPDALANSNTTADNSTLVARVNGQPIARSLFDRALIRWEQDPSIADIQALQGQVLDALIEQALIAQAAQTMGITVSDDDVNTEIGRLRESLGSDAAWTEYLTLNGYTEDEMFQAQHDALLTQRVQGVLFAGLDGQIKQVHARHIVVATEAESNEVMNRLRAGEDFATLAGSVSIDLTTRERGGDLGWFTIDELLDKRLADVAFALQPNAIAGPIATRIGYHVIQTLEFSERSVEPERLALLKRNIYLNWLDEQFQKASIERYIG
jgi:peptidyl-prolyl cis-trans isomerase C